MIRIVPMLGRVVDAVVRGAVGLMVGLVGIGVRLLTGRHEVVHFGAELIRSIDRWSEAAFVYFIQDEQAATKIGISGDPYQRLATLQTGHPENLRLLRSVRCRSGADARAVERDLHDFFARQRMNGEWFDLDARQLRRAQKLARRWR